MELGQEGWDRRRSINEAVKVKTDSWTEGLIRALTAAYRRKAISTVWVERGGVRCAALVHAEDGRVGLRGIRVGSDTHSAPVPCVGAGATVRERDKAQGVEVWAGEGNFLHYVKRC